MTADLAMLVPPGVWKHPHLRRWAVWLRRLGYRGALPRVAITTCQAVYPASHCACGLYRVLWGDCIDA